MARPMWDCILVATRKPVSDRSAAELLGLAADYRRAARTARQVGVPDALERLARRYEELARERTTGGLDEGAPPTGEPLPELLC
jgi:hypothetical protein